MKYIQFITPELAQTGKVFKWITDKEHKNDGYTSRRGAYLDGSEDTFSGIIDEWKDVTDIYNRIAELYLKYNWCNLSKWHDIKNIKDNFNKGKYPTKTDFRLMNQYHNDLITGKEVPRKTKKKFQGKKVPK